MCFSATASFAVSGGLAAVGVASWRAARPKERLIAIIPLAFAAQQAFEGVQWLALGHGTTCPAAGYGFLAFAYLFWPVYIPAVVYILDRPSRHLTRWFLFLGLGAAFWNAWYLLANPLTIYTVGGNIVYDVSIYLGEQGAVIYAIAASGALLVSRIRAFFWGGVIAIGTAVTAAALARPAFPSVWCFLAAIASVSAYLYVARRNQQAPWHRGILSG